MLTVLLMVGVAGISALTFAHFTGDERVRRALRKTPTTRIQDMGDDVHGKIVGRARGVGELLEAPVSGRRCVAYSLRVVPHDQRSSASTYHETKGVLFVIEDGTGRALVDPHHAQIAIGRDHNAATGKLADAPAAVELRVEEHGIRATPMTLYRETVLLEGEPIAVLGAGTREPDPDAPPAEAYRGDAPTRLRLTSSANYPLVISDDPAATR